MDFHILEKKRIREEWFKDHTANFSHFSVPENIPSRSRLWFNNHQSLHWAKQGTNIYSVLYVICGGTLFVTGDLGSAVYRWSENIDFVFLANCDIQYFSSKCEASDTGRGCRQWYEEKCRHELVLFIESISNDPENKWKKLNPKQQEEIFEACISAETWGRCLQDNYDLFGYSYDRDWGMDVSLLSLSHLIGIKMAVTKMAASVSSVVPILADNKTPPEIPIVEILQKANLIKQPKISFFRRIIQKFIR